MRIVFCSSSRADYSHLYWPLRRAQQSDLVQPLLVLFHAHAAPGFGSTGAKALEDEFEVSAQIESLLDADSGASMAKSLGIAQMAFAEHLAALTPDAVFVLADRYEMLAPAAAATCLRIPIVHLEGGDVSAGAIDDAVRNALTKLSHIHLVPHQPAADRVVGMLESPWRVRVVGAPSLDHLQTGNLPSADKMERRLELPPKRPRLLVAFHPITLHQDATGEAQSLFDALEQLDATTLFCYPNADAGSRSLLRKVESLVARHADWRVFENLAAPEYLRLLSTCDAIVGNSSSGIMEAASVGVAAVDIGDRQAGRLRGSNVLHAPAESAEIVTAIEQALAPEHRRLSRSARNPYGDGRASERILQVLEQLPSRARLLDKRS